jgi:hypothetical protein
MQRPCRGTRHGREHAREHTVWSALSPASAIVLRRTHGPGGASEEM